MPKLIINPLIGNKFLIDYNVDDTIDLIKNKISNKLNISPNLFFLAYKNKKINSLDNIINDKQYYINIIPYKNMFRDNGITVNKIII